jgi:hypothetical protein
MINSLAVPTPNGDLREVEFSRLKAVLSQLKAGLDASSHSLVQLRRTARQQPVPFQDRSQFDFAYAQVRACEVALRTSIEQAGNASAESAGELQAKVAENYEAYARAVTVAQAVAKNFIADNSGGHP